MQTRGTVDEPRVAEVDDKAITDLQRFSQTVQFEMLRRSKLVGPDARVAKRRLGQRLHSRSLRGLRGREQRHQAQRQAPHTERDSRITLQEEELHREKEPSQENGSEHAEDTDGV